MIKTPLLSAEQSHAGLYLSLQTQHLFVLHRFSWVPWESWPAAHDRDDLRQRRPY